MFFALFLICFLENKSNQRHLNDAVPPDPSPKVDPDTDFPHPTTAGVIITMILGITVIVTVVMPMCCMRQPDDYLYDPSKPLLQTPLT